MAEARGSILISTANKIGATLVKKLGGTGYTPSEWADKINLLGSLPEDTVSGAIANFPDGAEDVPVVELISNIDPTQAGSGDPAPDNVRAISGFTGMTVKRAGKNFWEFGNVTVPDTSAYLIRDFSNPLPAGTYRVSTDITSTSDYCHLRFRRADGSAIAQISFRANQGRVVYALSLPEPAYKVYVYSSTQPSGYTTTWTDTQIELGTAASDFVPYSAPEVKSISWETEAGTVYGGTLNVTTGELTVTKKLLELNVSDMNNSDTYPGWTNSGIRALLGPDINAPFNGQIGNVGSVFQVNTRFSNDVLFLPPSQYGGLDQTQWKETYPDLVVQFAIEIATPEVYQLSPEEVNTLLGVNNIYSDTGDVSVKYRADIPLYIEKITQ